MSYWLMKSEPSSYSWDQLVKDKKTSWNGVRNFQASANLKAMKTGDRVFFYHSNEGLAVVGIAPATLVDIKKDPKLKDMVLVKNSRLSVQPVTPEEWKKVCEMGGVKG